MPELSLQIDEKTLRKLEVAAQCEQLSVSNYVSKKLSELLNARWPENYGELFGSVNDETFSTRPSDVFQDDSAREDL